MTPAGWVFMMVSIGFVVTLLVGCFSLVLREPPPNEDEGASLDADALDRER